MQPPTPPSPFPTSSRSPPLPARAKSSNKTVLLIAAVATFVFCGFGVGAVALLAHAGVGEEVAELSDADRAMLVTFEDVAEFYDLAKSPAAEKFTRGGLLGSKELEYEYDDTDADGIYLMSSLTLERTAREARETYTGMHVTVGLMLGVAGEGVEKEERNDLFQWGDDSKNYLLTSEGQTVGNLFLARKGRHVYFLSMGGVALEDAEEFETLLKPRLERAAAWVP